MAIEARACTLKDYQNSVDFINYGSSASIPSATDRLTGRQPTKRER